MIYSYEEVILNYKNNYQLNKALKDKKIFDLLNEDYEKVKATMIIVLFIRTQRVLKYSKSDFPYYYKKYEELINL